MTPRFLPHDGLQALIDALVARGYKVIGPVVREGAVVLAPLEDAKRIPWGVLDVQAPGKYTLEAGNPQRAFGWVNGPSSLKPFLFKQQETLWQATVGADGRVGFGSVVEAHPQAVIGVRPCDIAAMRVQDRVFLEGEHVDIRYKARRDSLFTVVVNCTRAADTCFCTSQGVSTRAEQGYDLAMTEVGGGFVIEAGSETGAEVLQALSLDDALPAQLTAADAGIREAATTQKRSAPSAERCAQVLSVARDHPQWDRVAEQCEGCGNCTKLCPTCICHKQMYLPSLDGEGGEQVREWDSCHSETHGYVSGKNLRQARRERYRMRVTHKFTNMEHQFGLPGCVGCGRCISWCTKGIDVTENLAIIVGEGEPSDG